MSLTNIMDLKDNIHVVVYHINHFETICDEFDIVVSGNLTVDILLAKVIDGMLVNVDPSYRVDLVTKTTDHLGWDDLTNEHLENPD
ncbi:hypothetical protein GGI00_003961, partial [Coemansia sp. RSA 2681]